VCFNVYVWFLAFLVYCELYLKPQNTAGRNEKTAGQKISTKQGMEKTTVLENKADEKRK